jgi:hypothetical protein
MEPRTELQIGIGASVQDKYLCNQRLRIWSDSCLTMDMNIWVILLAIQVLISVVAFFRESGEDTQFEGDKLALRS